MFTADCLPSQRTSFSFTTLVILVCSTGPVLGFLFGTQCAAPPPCTCSLATINCKSEGLSQVPVFTIHSGHFYTFIVHLDFNHLTVIHANAFKNLSAVNATRINIELNNNHIANIDENAFSGIENALMILNLYSNNLLHVPIALTKLSSLRYLNLVRNPFVNIDASVLTNLSSIISIFKISADGTASLPHEMSFETSVTDLELSYSGFERIPSVVCGLKYLSSFTVNYTPNLNKYNSSIFDACNHTMPTVTMLSLQYDELTKVPKLASIFPNLDKLFLQGNALHAIESGTFVGLTSLTELDLSSNHLSRIPFAGNTTIGLLKLYVMDNDIHTIGDIDLLSLLNLTYIELYANPLVSVSPLAFSHNPLLTEIGMSATSLAYVPRGLLELHHLRKVFIDDKPMNCSCQAMDYLKSWNVTSVNIYASCRTGKSVKTYLITDLPKCP